jgi:2-polyprenyl-6-methoxyphenol hydroxylase-like FAD-dependent oxidoreductase
VARPHTAGGVSKAVTDAISLADAIRTEPTIDAAIEKWDRERSAAGHELVALGEALGRAVVTEVPDWTKMDAAATEAWWTNAMKGRTWYLVADAAT